LEEDFHLQAVEHARAKQMRRIVSGAL